MHRRDGIFRNYATMETQVWLNGRLIGACAFGTPQEAWQYWLRQIVSSLSPAELVRVYSPEVSDA